MRKRKSKRSAEFVHLVVYDEDGRLEDRISVDRNLRLKFFFTRSKVCKKTFNHLTRWPVEWVNFWSDEKHHFWSCDREWPKLQKLSILWKTPFSIMWPTKFLKLSIMWPKLQNFLSCKKQEFWSCETWPSDHFSLIVDEP